MGSPSLTQEWITAKIAFKKHTWLKVFQVLYTEQYGTQKGSKIN